MNCNPITNLNIYNNFQITDGKSTLMKSKEAVEYFNNGYNCSQAVVMAYAKEMNVDPETLEKVAVAFGGGMSKQGKTCGCLSGALMVIGLKYGANSTTQISQRTSSYTQGKDFITQFNNALGSTECRELIRLNLDDPKDMEKAQKENVFKNRCSKMVEKTIELLEENFISSH